MNSPPNAAMNRWRSEPGTQTLTAHLVARLVVWNSMVDLDLAHGSEGELGLDGSEEA